MSNDAPIGQNDIEDLLAGSGSVPDSSAASGGGASDSAAVGQDEIEALMASGGDTAGSTATAAAPAQTQAAAGSSNDVELLLDKAQAAIASIDEGNEPLPEGVEPFRLETFGGTPANTDSATIELVRDVQLDLKIELGRTHMPLEDVLRLRRDAVVTLDKLAGDPVDVYANGRLIARGEVLVLNDNFCVRVTELIVGDSAVA